jgi:hypothetical protein
MSKLPPLTRFVQRTRFARSVTSEVCIDAAPERVWQVLTDFPRYPDWNPFTAPVQARLLEGEAVTLTVHMLRRRPLTQVEYLHDLIESRRLCWGMVMGHPALLTASRVQTLEPLATGGTRYRSEDRLSGWLSPLVLALYGAAMQRGFDAMAAALKTRAETHP